MARARKFVWVRYFVAYTSGTAELMYAKGEADMRARVAAQGKDIESFCVVS